MALVEHIVLFRWTEEASQEAIDGAVAELRGLKGKIAGIVDWSCGANFSNWAKGCTHGLVLRFTDRAAPRFLPRFGHETNAEKYETDAKE